MTNRKLCEEPFLIRIRRLAAAGPAGIILREKDLPEEAYYALAKEVLCICKKYGVSLILHSFVRAAIDLGCERIHLPLPELERLDETDKKCFSVIGASCHSPADARLAERLGCTYITAGHVFDTDCKKGLPGRGTEFLQEVCGCVSIPVYAIGGITPERMQEVRAAGAAGACVMSAAMKCQDAAGYFSCFKTSGAP